MVWIIFTFDTGAVDAGAVGAGVVDAGLVMLARSGDGMRSMMPGVMVDRQAR